MKRPTISQYAETVANLHGLARTLPDAEADRDRYGNPVLTAGNNAAVFRVRSEGIPLALKCYTKPGPPDPRIYEYLSAHPDPLIVPARILEQELMVYDELGEASCHSVVAYPWTEGNSLRVEVKRAAVDGDRERLKLLSEVFEQAAAHLLAQPWAHGDLKPENIIVCPGDTLRFIDYDAMFVPTLHGETATELGTPGFRHPARTEKQYDAHIDDYSIALIATSLRALALDPALHSEYNRADNFLMNPEEILAGTSEAYRRVLALFAAGGDRTGYELAAELISARPELPGLARILSNASPRQTGGPWQMFEQRGLWGYRDAQGQVAVEAIYDEATPFSEGFAVVRLGGVPQVLTADGETLAGLGYDTIKPFSEGLAAVERGGRWGYMDRWGDLVIPLRFEIAGSMHEGRAAVRLGGKWGYIDAAGMITTEPAYDLATGVRHGRAMVCLGNETFYLDKA